VRSVSYTEIMIDDLKSLPDRKRELTTIENPLVHHFKERQIADIERLLTVVQDPVAAKLGVFDGLTETLNRSINNSRMIPLWDELTSHNFLACQYRRFKGF